MRLENKEKLETQVNVMDMIEGKEKEELV